VVIEMNYNEILINYIETIPIDEPILIEDIKKHFKNFINKNEFKKVFNTVYVYINRLVKENVLVQFAKGIYYKPKIGVFGQKKLNANKVITKKYIQDDNNIKGYFSGAYLFNQLGLTTQVPANIVVVTNERPDNNNYDVKKLGITLRKPKIKINKDNYLYLQLFDVLINKEQIKIEADNKKEIIYKFIYDNNLTIENIFKYANITKNKKVVDELYKLG